MKLLDVALKVDKKNKIANFIVVARSDIVSVIDEFHKYLYSEPQTMSLKYHKPTFVWFDMFFDNVYRWEVLKGKQLRKKDRKVIELLKDKLFFSVTYYKKSDLKVFAWERHNKVGVYIPSPALLAWDRKKLVETKTIKKQVYYVFIIPVSFDELSKYIKSTKQKVIAELEEATKYANSDSTLLEFVEELKSVDFEPQLEEQLSKIAVV